MVKWEDVGPIHTWRLKVEGGYLYRYRESLCFVPRRPGAHEAPRGGSNAIPSIRRPGPAEKATYRPPQPIDAEFEEVPPHQVNGSAARAGHVGEGHQWRRPSANVPGEEFD